MRKYYRSTLYFSSHSITNSRVLFFYYIMYILIHFYRLALLYKQAEGQETHMGEERRGGGRRRRRRRRKNDPQSFRGPVIGFSFADAWEHSHLCTHNDDENHLTNRVP